MKMRFSNKVLFLFPLVLFFLAACVPVQLAAKDGEATPKPTASLATTDDFMLTGIPEATQTPTLQGPPTDPIGTMLQNAKAMEFVPITAPTRVLRNPITISDGVILTYDATVTIPEATAYSIILAEGTDFSEEDLLRLRTLFPASQDAMEGEHATNKNSFFYIAGGDGFVARKNCMFYELDWQPAEKALFDEPILLTRGEAQPIAEQALHDMGATDYVLETAEEAILLRSNVQGEEYAASKGWDFVFVPQINGLPYHNYTGWFGNDHDPIWYYPTMSNYIWIYVDEQGISRVSWRCGAKIEKVVKENVELLSLDEAVTLANARFARLHPNMLGEGLVDIRVENIRLAAMVLGNSQDAKNAYSVPVWEFEYSITDSSAYRRICVLAMNAVDGGTVEAIEFPF